MSDPELRERIGGRPDLADLKAYRAPQIQAPVRLNTNESPYPPPSEVMQDLAERVSRLELNRYPDRDISELREGLAAHLSTLTERVWVANGSNEVIEQLLLAFGGPERKAMTFEPSYTLHTTIVRISGTRLLRARRTPDYALEVEASVEAIRSQEPDIVFLCSPNNPTGGVSSEEEVRAVCEAAQGLVILDEAYAEFARWNHLRLIDEYDHLVVVRTFSKAWRLAGARVGYLIAQPWVIDEITKVRLPYHVSQLTQAVGLTALAHAQELLSVIETIRHERERLYRELSTTRGVAASPSDANFIFFRCLEAQAPLVWQGLLDRGVLIRDFSELVGCEGGLRVSVGTAEEDERFLEALTEALGR